MKYVLLKDIRVALSGTHSETLLRAGTVFELWNGHYRDPETLFNFSTTAVLNKSMFDEIRPEDQGVYS